MNDCPGVLEPFVHHDLTSLVFLIGPVPIVWVSRYINARRTTGMMGHADVVNRNYISINITNSVVLMTESAEKDLSTTSLAELSHRSFR